MTEEQAKPIRKTRSDEGTKRDVVYIVTRRDLVEESGGMIDSLVCLGTGPNAEKACAEAAKAAAPGQQLEVWRRVGKPREVQLRLV
jgi:hypothetical protein